MIRVHFIDGAPVGEAAEGASAPTGDPDWKTLDDLAHTALLLARRLREQQDADGRAAEGGGIESAESDATTSAVTVSDLLEEGQDGRGAGIEVPTARDSPDA